MSQSTVLLIEDDDMTRTLLARAFGRVGLRTIEAEDGREGLRAIYASKPDAVLLDIEMPEMNGFDALERIRQVTDVPVMMVTGKESQESKLRAFDAGADDYVTKPFELDEVVARTRALMRRRGTEKPSDRYVDEHIEVDFSAVEARANGQTLTLTPLQFRLLSTLVRHPNQALTPDQLLDLAWRGESFSPERVKVHVANLRKKLGQTGTPPECIETVRGFGYRYRKPR